MNIKYVRYSSGTPTYCASQAAYLYASVGASAKIGVGIASKTFSKSIEIWGKNNSPVRVYYHIEDGVLRTSCTRGKEFAAQGGWTSYWTSPGSRYFNPAGVGSYFDAGAGAGGAIVPIYTYTLDDANRATITGYSGNATALYIPGEIDGHEVVAIGDRAFENRTDLRTVMIPDSVTRINGNAFYGCSNLANVTLSKNLEELGTSAFGNCTSIAIIEIPKSLKSAHTDWESLEGYSNGPFEKCSNLKKVTFEKGSTKVAQCLFAGCSGITDIEMPDTITVIEVKAVRLRPCDRKAEGIRCPELQPHPCGTSHLLRSSMRANRPAAINLLPAKDSIRRSAPYNVTRVSPMSRQMRCGVKSSTLRQPSVSRLPPRSSSSGRR